MKRHLTALALATAVLAPSAPALAQEAPAPPEVATAEAEVAAYLEHLWAERQAVQAFLEGLYVDRFRSVLDCIAARESGGSYAAVNRRSSASGRYQFLDSTWRTMSARAGRPGWARAVHAPPEVQDLVAAYTVDTLGIGPWRASGAHRACA